MILGGRPVVKKFFNSAAQLQQRACRGDGTDRGGVHGTGTGLQVRVRPKPAAANRGGRFGAGVIGRNR